MNFYLYSFKLGVARAVIEFKQFLRSPQNWIWTIITTSAFLAVLWFQRDEQIEGVSLALLTLPSLLGMSIAMGGLSSTASQLSYDREDGTLLRAKAVPQGISAYLVSRVILVFFTTLLSLALLFIPSLLLIEGLTSLGWHNLLTVMWVFLLGMLATAPIGAIIGSLVKSSNSGWGITFLMIIGLGAISGIFYPITMLASWLQVVGQIFPVYWLGLGLRSALSPESAMLAEISGSYRTAETIIVLSIWAIIGLAVGPRILRRMAQRASGSDMEANRQNVLNRGY